MNLGEVLRGRDNNINLLRVIGATLVLVSHSWPLTQGFEDTEPLHGLVGMSLGVLALDLFFVLSGFLITASMVRNRSYIAYFWSRVLRIFPGLIAMLVVTVFGLGLVMSNLTPAQYLTSGEVYRYFGRCATLVFGLDFSLPGVFEDNPFPNAFNGSLWTLKHEMYLYILVAVLWAAVRPFKRHRTAVFTALVAGLAIMFAGLSLSGHAWIGAAGPNTRLWGFFLVGASMYMLRDHIHLSLPGAATIAVTAVLAAGIATGAYEFVYWVALPYLALFLSFAPGRLPRMYNRVGDYSYGIYVYAFPIQQTVVALWAGIAPLTLMAVAFPITLGCAMLSWKYIEEPALAQRHRMADMTRSLVNRFRSRRPQPTEVDEPATTVSVPLS